MKKNLRHKILVVLAALYVVAALMFAGRWSYAWLSQQRSLATLGRVENPTELHITDTNNDATAIRLRDIDTTAENGSSRFPFIVHGNGVQLYQIELAYTQNIPFTYQIFEYDATAEERGKEITMREIKDPAYAFPDGSEIDRLAKPIYKVSDTAISGENGEPFKHNYLLVVSWGNIADALNKETDMIYLMTNTTTAGTTTSR